MRRYFFFLFGFFLSLNVSAQGQWFSFRTGTDLNFQQWNNSQRNALITPFAEMMVESYDEDSPSSLYALAGYHTRGSSVLFNFFNFADGFGYKFRNITLELGGKRYIREKDKFRPYYMLGIRGEYTIGTNLSEFETNELAIVHPLNEFVNEFNYGVSLGAGFDYPVGELTSVYFELAMRPDLSLQYDQPPLTNVVLPSSPFINTDRVNLPERRIRNLSLAITVGFRFLRKVEYID